MKPYWLPLLPKHQCTRICTSFFSDPFHQLGLVFYPTGFERLNFIIPKLAGCCPAREVVVVVVVVVVCP